MCHRHMSSSMRARNCPAPIHVWMPGAALCIPLKEPTFMHTSWLHTEAISWRKCFYHMVGNDQGPIYLYMHIHV